MTLNKFYLCYFGATPKGDYRELGYDYYRGFRELWSSIELGPSKSSVFIPIKGQKT